MRPLADPTSRAQRLRHLAELPHLDVPASRREWMEHMLGQAQGPTELADLVESFNRAQLIEGRRALATEGITASRLKLCK